MIKETIKTGFFIRGEVEINGQRKANAVTQNGLSHVLFCLIGNAMPLKYIGVGDSDAVGTPADIYTQTELQNELARNVATKRVIEQGESIYSAVYNISSVFNGGPDSGLQSKTVKERGLFDRYKNGLMFAREIGNDSNFTFEVEKDFNWRVIFEVGQDPTVTGGIVNSACFLLARSLMQYDASAVSSEGYPYGLNLVALGTSPNSTSSDTTDLFERMPEHDTRPTVTNLDFSDPDNPVLKIQKYIPLDSVFEDVAEVGIFNNYKRTPNSLDDLEFERETMFLRAPLSRVIPAGEEATIDFEIKLSRG